MRMTCIKCGLVNPQAEGPDSSCPKCGAIYSKARPATAPRAASDGLSSGFSAPSTLSGASATTEDYVRRLRSGSQYPTFRTVAGVLCLLGYLVGLVMLIGGLVSGWKFGTGAPLFIGIAVGLVIIVLSKAAKEASLMLADLSDATLRMARRQEADR